MAREGLPAVAALGDACCGCGACAARCPKGCIEMVPDGCGFPRPRVDAAACVGCGACDAVCPALSRRPGDGCESVLWARAKDPALLGASSSGGVFGLLARDAIARGGVVVGAEWGDGCRAARHALAADEGALGALMRSKYVQSSVGRDVYEGVRDALRTGVPVLFSGTACQVSGMRAYLGALADSDLFLGVDVICHGVPSPGLWRRWVEFVEGREGAPVRSVNFRSKETGWTRFSVRYELGAPDGGGRAISSVFPDDWYMRAFLRNASLRPSCYRCPAKRSCGSDLTLGDYWGIRERHPEAFRDDGVSAVLVNTERGAAALARVAPLLETGESDLDGVSAGNPSLLGPVSPHPDREAFMLAVERGKRVEGLMRKWSFSESSSKKMKAWIKRLLLGKGGRSVGGGRPERK